MPENRSCVLCYFCRAKMRNVVKIGDIEVGEFPLLLAPMEDVSDPPFRALCKENGADVMYTEFTSTEGLIRDAAKKGEFPSIECTYLLCRLIPILKLVTLLHASRPSSGIPQAPPQTPRYHPSSSLGFIV